MQQRGPWMGLERSAGRYPPIKSQTRYPPRQRRVEWNSDTLSGVWREIHQPYIKLKKVTYLSSILPLNKVYGTLTKQRIAVLKVTSLLSLFRFKASMVLLRYTYSRGDDD